MVITTMMVCFILHFSCVLFSIEAEQAYIGTCVSLEVACFLTTDCTGSISDDVFLNGHHLTHCGNLERVLDLEWYLFILTCKKGKRNIWSDNREEWLRFSVFYLFVR